MNFKQIILMALAFLFLADSIWLTVRSNWTVGLFLMYLVTGGLFFFLRYEKAVYKFCSAGFGRLLKYGFFAGVCFFAGLCLLMAFSARNTSTGKEKAVVVLGAGLHGDEISDTLRRRLDTALDYHKQNPDALIVVSGGQGPQESVTEAWAMAQYLQKHGISEDQILLEDRSDSTETNFRYSADVLQQAGVDIEQDAICFITNNFHCYRAASYARREGYQNITCRSTGTALSVLPSSAMREALAVCALWAKGLLTGAG